MTAMNLDCPDKSLLVAYLYGECDANEREAFERHLARCAACSTEVDALGEVRAGLQEWTPPEAALGFRVVRDDAPERVVAFTPKPENKENKSRWSALPVWARFAAAVLVLAVGAAIANFDIRVGNGGLSIRTGWQQPAATQAVKANDGAPWRAEMAAFERNVRRELAPTAVASQAGSGAVPMNASAPLGGAPGARGLSAAEAAELTRRVNALIADSERRQQQAFENMLATRLVQFGRDVEYQRRTDLQRIQQGLGQFDTRTTSELAQLKEMQRYIVSRVANIQEIK